MMRTVLIGTGMVANTHLAALKDAEGISLAGVMGRNTQKTRAFAKKASALMGYHIPAFDNVEQFALPDVVDFAIIATPPDARLDLVKTLTSGKIPVLMEKPLERNFLAAREIVDLCEASAMPCGVIFQNRTREAAIALKDTIDKGLLGDTIMVEIRVPWWRDQSYYDEPGRGTYARDGGGVLINQAIHTIDLALWVLGPWKHVQAQLRTTKLHCMEAEDWAGAVFETLGGAVGTLMATTAAYPGASESIFVMGTKGNALLEAGVLTVNLNDGSSSVTGQTANSGGGADPMAFSHAWHQKVIEDFGASLSNGGEPLASARSALQAHAVIDAMEQSNKTGQREKVARI